jgi:hypothetical protein
MEIPKLERSTNEEPEFKPVWKIDTRTGEAPEWDDISNEALMKMFKGIIEYCNDGEIDNLDWSRLNFDYYDEDYYRDKFGEGFPDEYYKIMADSTREPVQDYRQHPLIIEKKEVIVKFD